MNLTKGVTKPVCVYRNARNNDICVLKSVSF